MYVPISGVLLGRGSTVYSPVGYMGYMVCVFTIVKLRNGGMYCA